MQRDIVLWTSSNLAGPWSAGEITGSLTAEMLNDMTAAFDRMEPLVRVRLLIACAFLKPARRAELAPELRALAAKASGDDHEWVRLYATALAEADGRIRLDNSAEAFPVVRTHGRAAWPVTGTAPRRSCCLTRCCRGLRRRERAAASRRGRRLG